MCVLEFVHDLDEEVVEVALGDLAVLEEDVHAVVDEDHLGLVVRS